jgi:hypothetical protein
VENENLHETNELLAFIQNKTQDLHNATIFVMGDFNQSPEDVTIQSSFPSGYNQMINSGFGDTIIKLSEENSTNPVCTYCPSDKLAGTILPTTPRALDHIYVSQV